MQTVDRDGVTPKLDEIVGSHQAVDDEEVAGHHASLWRALQPIGLYGENDLADLGLEVHRLLDKVLKGRRGRPPFRQPSIPTRLRQPSISPGLALAA
jgi:hypothetical protein